MLVIWLYYVYDKMNLNWKLVLKLYRLFNIVSKFLYVVFIL